MLCVRGLTAFTLHTSFVQDKYILLVSQNVHYFAPKSPLQFITTSFSCNSTPIIIITLSASYQVLSSSLSATAHCLVFFCPLLRWYRINFCSLTENRLCLFSRQLNMLYCWRLGGLVFPEGAEVKDWVKRKQNNVSNQRDVLNGGEEKELAWIFVLPLCLVPLYQCPHHPAQPTKNFPPAGCMATALTVKRSSPAPNYVLALGVCLKTFRTVIVTAWSVLWCFLGPKLSTLIASFTLQVSVF